MCFTESSLDYNVVHRGIWDTTTKGICGLGHWWESVLDGVDRNSLQAGGVVLDELLTRYNSDLFLAMSHYKGANKNYETVLKVLWLIDKIEEVHK